MNSASPSPVFIRHASYEYDDLKKAAREILENLDQAILSEGAKVLIKPNLLRAARPELAVTTHPSLVRAVAEYLLEKGCRVLVADSPAAGSFEKIVEECGLARELEGLPVTVKALEGGRPVDLGGAWKSVELSREALDADVIINLPKLKTHAQMVLTLAVKNLFGCVVGLQKPQWHLRIGEDRGRFAGLLVSIAKRLNPAVTIVDGVLAMEGDGPGTGGTPRELGVLIGGSSVFAVDEIVCGMLGLPVTELPTHQAAVDMGLALGSVIDGKVPDVARFALPESQDLVFGPGFMKGFLRRHLTSRPASVRDLCLSCDECVDICPAGAVTSGGEIPSFDYDACIRCYCCLEICPHGAMRKHETWLKKTLGAASRAFRKKS